MPWKRSGRRYSKPKTRRDADYRWRRNECCKCKGLGHWASACTETPTKPLQIGKDQCAKCNELGHWAKDCPKKSGDKGEDSKITPQMICSVWNRNTLNCKGECGQLHICSNIKCRRITDRHPATHLQHRLD